jgi:hypothetical protein
MALDARDVNVTREDVYGWLKDYKRASNLPSFKTSQRDYLLSKLAEKGHGDTKVRTDARDDIKGPDAALIDLIMADIDSYG